MNRLFFILLALTLSMGSADAQIWDAIKEKTIEYAGKAKEGGSKLLAKCQYTVPITQRKFVNVIPDDFLNDMAKSQYQSVLSTATRSSNSQQAAQLKRVSKRVIKAVNSFYTNHQLKNNFSWEVNLLEEEEANAWCMPGGKIAVYSGILEYANDDASLAIVLSHEIAHAIAKHSAEQMTKGLVTAAGVIAVYSIINNSDMSSRKKELSKALAAAGVTLTSLKFSRIDETEADRLGLIIAAMAGYNPEAAIPFWERMGENSVNQSIHDWYSTHPSNANRISNIKGFLPEAQQYYTNYLLHPHGRG